MFVSSFKFLPDSLASLGLELHQRSSTSYAARLCTFAPMAKKYGSIAWQNCTSVLGLRAWKILPDGQAFADEDSQHSDVSAYKAATFPSTART